MISRHLKAHHHSLLEWFDQYQISEDDADSSSDGGFDLAKTIDDDLS